LFGMYNYEDFQYYLNHKNTLVVVWCGTDGLMLSENKAKILKSKSAIHIAKSKFISTDLARYNISHRILPVTWQIPEINLLPRGENIFHYGNNNQSKFYGENYLPLIEKITGLNIIRTTINTYSKEDLKDIYAKCFIGLRLTNHDGVPNTVIELGMMGRRCIYNGELPNAIPWNNIDDICANIMKEYNNKNVRDEEKIAKSVKKFIDIDDDWLNVA
jgi:hypothetical protein